MTNYTNISCECEEDFDTNLLYGNLRTHFARKFDDHLENYYSISPKCMKSCMEYYSITLGNKQVFQEKARELAMEFADFICEQFEDPTEPFFKKVQIYQLINLCEELDDDLDLDFWRDSPILEKLDRLLEFYENQLLEYAFRIAKKSVRKIETYFLDAYYSPHTEIGKRRFNKELDKLNLE